MKRISVVALAALLMSAPVAWGWCLNCTRVRPIPPEACGPCPDQCKHGFFPPLSRKCAVEDKIHVLYTDPNFAHRVCAVEWLGCCMHDDACADPEVMEALFAALQCDPAWEVRRAGAIAIRHQHLLCRTALMALYIAAKTDPHFTVRLKSAESLDILTVPYPPSCFKDMRKQGDALIVELRRAGYKPGSEHCRVQLGDACSHCDIAPFLSGGGAVYGELIEAPDRAPLVIPAPMPEAVPAPKTAPKSR
jgi:HEAT repeats